MDKIMGVPGVRAARSAVARSYLCCPEKAVFLPKNLLIDGAKSRDAGNTPDVNVLRAGKLLGKITTGGKYRPSIVGLSTVAYADNDTTITVAAETATEIARLKALGGGGDLSMLFIGPPSAAGTVASTAITVSAVAATTITVGDLNLAKVVGSILALADGSATPRVPVPEGYGLKVTDQDEVSEDQEFNEILVQGIIKSSQLIDYPADTSTRAWLKTQMRLWCPGLLFDDDF